MSIEWNDFGLLQVGLDVIKNFLGMGIRFHGCIDFFHHALLVDHIGVTRSHTRFAKRAKSCGHFLFRISKQWDFKLLFFHKLLLQFEGISADTKDNSVKCGEFFSKTAESARFLGSATGHGFGVEEKNDILLSLEVTQIDFCTLGLGCRA